MNHMLPFAAVYNCIDSADSSYGSSAYSTCAPATNEQSQTSNENTHTVGFFGAPNTGVAGIIQSPAFGILFTLIITICTVVASIHSSKQRKQKNSATTHPKRD